MDKNYKSHESYGTVYHNTSEKEIAARESLLDLFINSPIQGINLLNNLGLYIDRQNISRILYMHELYMKALNVHGIIAEFGTRWGQNLALFENFRGIHEPYSAYRKIIGFDTFEGFASLDEKDGTAKSIKDGSYSVSPGYEQVLEKILDFHEANCPISHTKKYELIKGDATVTAKKYFDENPHTIIALAYFDFDLYKPTYECLKVIGDHVTKGSVIAFDELNCDVFPRETLALCVPYNPGTSYIVID